MAVVSLCDDEDGLGLGLDKLLGESATRANTVHGLQNNMDVEECDICN